MKALFIFPIVAVAAIRAVGAETPASHQDMAEALLDFLSRTELCLRSCTDEASVNAALPQLRQLATEADKLAAAQTALPEPTVQDFMSVQDKMGTFDSICKAIQAHLVRLSERGLLNNDFRQILKISL
ncbi:MAG: hypothetical protein IJ498_02190 [Akkermansia sp.]|nr:hypothetical protein [Akkermansia sp.]